MASSASEDLKVRGNAAVAEKKWEAALVCYQQAQTLLTPSESQLKVILMSNISLVQLQLGRHQEALEAAAKCMALDAKFEKGYLRYAAALEAMNLKVTDPALLDTCPVMRTFKKGLQENPGSALLVDAVRMSFPAFDLSNVLGGAVRAAGVALNGGSGGSSAGGGGAGSGGGNGSSHGGTGVANGILGNGHNAAKSSSKSKAAKAAKKASSAPSKADREACVPLDIRGATGQHELRINGRYDPCLDELSGGWPVYKKRIDVAPGEDEEVDEDDNLVLEFHAGLDEWMVKHVTMRGTHRSFAFFKCSSMMRPELCRDGAWQSHEEKKHVFQSSMTVLTVAERLDEDERFCRAARQQGICLPIEVRGAVGCKAQGINGIYEPTDVQSGGWPVYRKLLSEELRLIAAAFATYQPADEGSNSNINSNSNSSSSSNSNSNSNSNSGNYKDDDNDDDVVVRSAHHAWPAIPATVLRCVQSRKTEHITLVAIPLSFPDDFDTASWQRADKTSADFESLRYPTARIKSLRRALQQGGHTVVGDGGAVKSAKGVYASVDRVRFAGNTRNKPFDVCVPLPRKFEALMEKEQFLHDLARSKHAALVQAWAVRRARGPAGPGRRTSAEDDDDGDIGCDRDDDDDDDDDDYDDDDDAGSKGSDACGPGGAGRSLEQMQAMLADGVPVEYILGEAEFCGLCLEVTPHVMIPKRSSEVLVTVAVTVAVAAVTAAAGGGARVLDLGTGSGCLLLGTLRRLLDALPHAPPGAIAGLGTDISAPALAVAVRNAAALGLGDAAAFRTLDFADLTPLLGPTDTTEGLGDHTDTHTDTHTHTHTHTLCGPFNVILCNPPYSSRREGRLSVAATDHEPALALFAQGGPLGAYRTIALALQEAEHEAHRRTHGHPGQPPPAPLFAPHGRLVLEVGAGQDAAVRGIVVDACGAFLRPVGAHKDHKGIVRCLEWEYSGTLPP